MSKENYSNLDGLRTVAAISIILMHVLTNITYEVNGLIPDIILKAGQFVQLFFIISGFGMCCGYYEKIKNNQISLNEFYNKRYLKLLPYFALLVITDVAIAGFNSNSVIEGFSDLTLLYGFFPNSDISVIGVGWAMGVIFAFYCLFPFFVYMMWNKKRAWFWLVITIVINYICTYYFNNNGEAVGCNIARWMCYFITGGMIFLYRENIISLFNKNKYISLSFTVISIVLWYLIPGHIYIYGIQTIKLIVLFSVWMSYAISIKSTLLSNRITRFISKISFEIYLAHMMIFRVVEKLHLTQISSNNALSYIVTSLMVIVGVIIFAVVAKQMINKFECFIEKKIRRMENA